MRHWCNQSSQSNMKWSCTMKELIQTLIGKGKKAYILKEEITSHSNINKHFLMHLFPSYIRLFTKQWSRWGYRLSCICPIFRTTFFVLVVDFSSKWHSLLKEMVHNPVIIYRYRAGRLLTAGLLFCYKCSTFEQTGLRNRNLI